MPRGVEGQVAALHPDIAAYLWSYIGGFLLIFNFAWTGFLANSPLGEIIVPLQLVLVFFGFALIASAEFVRRTTTYYIGHSGLKREYRFIAVHSSFISYNDIEQLKVTQGFWQRIFNIGTILIETAGSETEVELTFHDVRSPREVEAYIRKRIEAEYEAEVFEYEERRAEKGIEE